MQNVAVFAFLAAAVLGAIMAVLHWQGKKSGLAMGIVHGLLAASGIVLLGVGLGQAPDAGPWWWLLAAFGVTAAGGVFLFVRQQQGKPWPNAVIVTHGAAALLSVGLLVTWIVTRAPEIEPVQPTPAEQLDNSIGHGGAIPDEAP